MTCTDGEQGDVAGAVAPDEFPWTSHSSSSSSVEFLGEFENPPQCRFDLSFRACDKDELSILASEDRSD